MKIEHMKAIIAGAEASLRTVADDENFQTISSKIDVDLQTIIQGLYDLYEAIDSQNYSEVEKKVENIDLNIFDLDIFDILETK